MELWGNGAVMGAEPPAPPVTGEGVGLDAENRRWGRDSRFAGGPHILVEIGRDYSRLLKIGRDQVEIASGGLNRRGRGI